MTGEVGIRIKGSNGQIQIDDVTPTMVGIYRGQATPANMQALTSTNQGTFGRRHIITFPGVISSQEPPLVFCQFITSRVMMTMMTLIGSPGAWTGFSCCIGYIEAYAEYVNSGRESTTRVNRIINLAPPLFNGAYFNWFVAGRSPYSTDKIGIRIRNRNTGVLMYDSGFPIVKFLAQSSAFTALGRLDDYGHYWARTFLRYGIGKPAGDVYFLANTLNAYFNGNPGYFSAGKEDGYDAYHLVYCYVFTDNAIPYQSFLWTALFATLGS